MRNEISKQLKVNNVKELYHLQDELYKIASKRANKTEEVQFKNLMKYAKNPVVIYQAMNNIKSNKGSDTPGPDGLTIRDYLKMIDTEFLEFKINNLITVCYKCHCKIHSNNEVNDTDLKTKKQIIKYRNKFNES